MPAFKVSMEIVTGGQPEGGKLTHRVSPICFGKDADAAERTARRIYKRTLVKVHDVQATTVSGVDNDEALA